MSEEENGKLRVEFEKVYEDNLTLAQELEQEKEKNKELEATNNAFHHFIMFNGGKDIKDISATEYMRIRQEGYIDGRCYEQQKAKEIITNNYISKDKIKEKIEELEKEQKEYEDSQEWEVQDDIYAKIIVLEELLEEGINGIRRSY